MTGKEVIAELVVELRASIAQAEQFEGEMRNLAAYARALAQALDCIRSADTSRCLLLPLTPVQPSEQLDKMLLKALGSVPSAGGL